MPEPAPERTPPDKDMAYDPEVHDQPPVLDVHKAALQEIDRIVGNEATLDANETSRIRGILFAALAEQED